MGDTNDTGIVQLFKDVALTHNVFHNYLSLMTFAERAAYKSVMAEEKAENTSSEAIKRILRGQQIRFWINSARCCRTARQRAAGVFDCYQKSNLARSCQRCVSKLVSEMQCACPDAESTTVCVLRIHVV